MGRSPRFVTYQALAAELGRRATVRRRHPGNSQIEVGTTADPDETSLSVETYLLVRAFLTLPPDLRRSEIERMERLAEEMAP